MIAIEEIQKLIDLMKATEVMELSVESNGVKIFLRRSPLELQEKASDSHAVATANIEQTIVETLGAHTKPATTPIISPLVGIFHNGGMLDRRTFLREGDIVKEGQVIAVVEAMKVPNELRSPINGIVSHVLVEDGVGVEYGQPLLIIEPENGAIG